MFNYAGSLRGSTEAEGNASSTELLVTQARQVSAEEPDSVPQ